MKLRGDVCENWHSRTCVKGISHSRGGMLRESVDK